MSSDKTQIMVNFKAGPECGELAFLRIDDSPNPILSTFAQHYACDVDGISKSIKATTPCVTHSTGYQAPVMCEKGWNPINLALDGTATQSSLFDVLYAHYAIDNKRGTMYTGCTHTAEDDSDPWWLLDLGGVATIESVTMLNRGDACAERLTNITITVGMVEHNLHYCGAFDGSADLSQDVLVTCDSPVDGRYLKIAGGGRHCSGFPKMPHATLTLCEVEVYGQRKCGDYLYSRCPIGWLFRACSCYKFSSHSANWYDAKMVCFNAGGYLMEIHSAEENSVVEEEFRTSVSQMHDFWIGGTDAYVEGVWKWSYSGTDVLSSNWYPGQPDNFFNEDCLALPWGSRGDVKWEDRSCYNTLFFICQRSILLPESVAGSASSP
ncbi:hypothetical protein ScPMuIL_016801 [Solemya velum]